MAEQSEVNIHIRENSVAVKSVPALESLDNPAVKTDSTEASNVGKQAEENETKSSLNPRGGERVSGYSKSEEATGQYLVSNISCPQQPELGKGKETIMCGNSMESANNDHGQSQGMTLDNSAGIDVQIKDESSKPQATLALPTQSDEPMVSLILRPVDKEWEMGEDWITEISALKTIMELKEHVERHKGISPFRMQLRIKGKVIVPARDNWSLRRIGIADNTIVNVEPTLSGSWYWNDRQYYEEKLLGEVVDCIEKEGGTITYTKLCQTVKCPPPIKSSLRVFLKTYPERIHVTTDISMGCIYLQQTKHAYQLPVYDTIPIEIGHMTHYKPKYFDWQGHEDVDDMYNIETVDENIAEEETLLDTVGGGEGALDDRTSNSKKEETATSGALRNKSVGKEVHDGVEGNDNGGVVDPVAGGKDVNNTGAIVTVTGVEENALIKQEVTESAKAKVADDTATEAARIAVEEEDEQNAAALL